MTKLMRGLASGERCLGHDDLDLRLRRIASGLLALGVQAGDCIAILMRNDIAFIEAAFAAQSVGAYAVPINWHFKAKEIVHILADCSAKVLFAMPICWLRSRAGCRLGWRRSPSPRHRRSRPPMA